MKSKRAAGPVNTSPDLLRQSRAFLRTRIDTRKQASAQMGGFERPVVIISSPQLSNALKMSEMPVA